MKILESMSYEEWVEGKVVYLRKRKFKVHTTPAMTFLAGYHIQQEVNLFVVLQKQRIRTNG